MAPALLFSQMTPPPGEEDAFHRWYDEDHIAARMAVDGFSAAHRLWADGTEPHHLALYELDGLASLETAGYRALKADPGDRTRHFLSAVTGFTRFTAERISDTGAAGAVGSHLFVVAFAVPEADAEEFDRWYDDEHAPLLLRAPDWLRVHRYRVLDGEGGPWTRLALHELASTEVMESPQRAAARRGPLREALADRPWFGGSGRWLYRRLVSHGAHGRTRE